MEQISIFKAINSVESNLSTIFTKQDVINLLNTIDVAQTIDNGMYWKKSAEEWQKMYESEFEQRSKLEDDYKQMYGRLTYVKNGLWNFNKASDSELYVYEMIENENDKDFINNMKFVIQNEILENVNEGIMMYKSDNNLVNWDTLYENFRRRVNGFEFDEVCSSCDFEINSGNEIHVSSADINTNHICDELEYAYDEIKE